MKTSSVWDLDGTKIVIPFDAYGVPTKDATSIYGQILEQLACEPINLLITYANWKTMPKTWKDELFDKEIKVHIFYIVSCFLYMPTKVVFFIL